MIFETLPELLRARTQLTPSREAYREFDPKRQIWVSHSWSEVAARIDRWCAALQVESFPLTSRIAVLVRNSVDHVCMDQAAMALGYIPVPLHVIDNAESLAYILADSGAVLLLVESLSQWNALAPLQSSFANLRRVVYLRGGGADSTRGIALRVEEWLGQAEGKAPKEAVSRASSSADALAAIVYTSGTTGRPKGVMLSHRNVVTNIKSIMAILPVREDDMFLSFLPLSHTLERTVGYYLPMAAGANVAFARSVQLLMTDIANIKPTVLVSVPRIYERAHAMLRESVDRYWVTKVLFAAAVRLGWQQFEYRQQRTSRLPLLSRVIGALLDRLIAAPVRDRFGGRVRAAVTGGAAMSIDVARPLLALGVPILQGYGMTESAPVISCNTPDDNDPESVGRALPHVEIRIGEQDELLARGGNIMMGYWGRPEDTAAVREPDGWLHTGDQARLKGGRLYIHGRLKDIMVTSTGEKIAPADIEAAITSDPLFAQVMVIGERRPYLIALAVLNPLLWQPQAYDLGLNPESEADLKSAAATRFALDRISRAARALPRYATPRAVSLSLKSWTVEAGLITPTLKPKRQAIEARYAIEIAELYHGH